jgi:hypothetical protein
MVLFGIVVILVCMWGLKEKVSELIQRVKDCFDVAWRFWFLFIIFILTLFSIFKYTYSYPFQIDNESAMYFLSALVQSQAAILAIVITLTLIVVQLASSHYSPRVIDIFKKDPAIWWFLCYYGFSIFFGLYILMMMQVIQNENPDILTVSNCYSYHISLVDWIYAAYFIAIGTFVVLFLHIKNVFNLLKPSNIIKKLSDDITKENISKHTKSMEEHKKDQTKPIEEDPIQPIMDIIHSSIMKYDLETVRVGLKAVTDQMIEIIDSDNQKEIITGLCDHFRRVRMLAVDKMDEEAIGEVIKSLETFGKSTAKKNLGYATQKIARSIELTGELAAKKGEYFDASTWQAVESLELVEKVVIKKGEKFKTVAAAIALSFSNVAIAAAENKREWPTIWAVSSLEEIGKDAVKHELVRVTKTIVFTLLRVGVIAAKKGLNATEDAAHALAALMILSEEIVGNVIRNYESEIKEQDHDALQKFMKMYEQELEKQLSKKPECLPHKKETHS